MKIISSTLFLTFVGVLYFESADGRVPPHVRYVMVRFKDYTRYHGFLSLVSQNKRLDDPHSLRPLWMTHQDAHRPFAHYSIYMEMSYHRRYTSGPLEHSYLYPDHLSGRHLPEFAYVYFADHKYLATHFVKYNASRQHSNVADDDKGGRIYITIKNTPFVYYTILRYLGVSTEDVPNLPRLPRWRRQ